MCKIISFVVVAAMLPFVLCRSDLRGKQHGLDKHSVVKDKVKTSVTDSKVLSGFPFSVLNPTHDMHRGPLNVDYVVVNVTVPSDSEGSPFTTYVQATDGDWFSVLFTPISDPSVTPTKGPTVIPTVAPTDEPTVEPTVVPSVEPSIAPTISPSVGPTFVPTIRPTDLPTILPTQSPTVVPTIKPSASPTVSPTRTPTVVPTTAPTTQLCWCYNGSPYYPPTVKPTTCPSVVPTTAAPSVSFSPTSLSYLPPAFVYYSFETSDLSGSYLSDRSGNGHTATLSAGASLDSTVYKRGSSAFHVSGTANGLSQTSSLAVHGAVSYAFWMNAAACSPDQNHMYVFALYNSVGAGEMSFYIDKNCKPSVFTWIGTQEYPDVMPAMSLNTWYHFVWTVASDGTWKVYRNGELSWTVSAQSITNGFTMNIGNFGGEPYQHAFNGYVDDFYMFQTALTANQVQLLYNQA